MKNIKLNDSFNNLSKALAKLSEVLNDKEISKNYAIDLTIKRFEFSYEALWKTLKRFLEHSGIEAKTPRDIFKEAYSVKWIDNGEIFLDMLEDRNATSHEYNEKKAEEVFLRIKKYYPEMDKVKNVLEKKFNDNFGEK